MPETTFPLDKEGISSPTRKQKTWRRIFTFCVCAAVAQLVYQFSYLNEIPHSLSAPPATSNRDELRSKCANLHTPAGPPAGYAATKRMLEGSDRWVPGTPPVLLKNAKIWTGAKNGSEIVQGDVLLHMGLVAAVGDVPASLISDIRTLAQLEGTELVEKDVGGRWITPGLVDLHSHIGVYSSPALNGASDGNSRKSPILPWLRSIDGLNTHDESYQLAMAGGVTTAQILPGSANNIGGQAFVIKLRPTADRSATAKVIEPPLTLTHSPNGTEYIRWRHMKHACGENPDRLYGQTRMDGQWNFRNAYNEARKIRDAQDAFCHKVETEAWDALEADGEAQFPEDLQWESLVDVLRGRVKLSIHCYEAVDLDGIVRLSNEFKFPVASFHHAGETYLVPDLLKKTWGGAPSIALFANNFRKKREAYRGSEFAPRVLAEHGIPVVMKSDHPVVNSRYLLFEAQQAHYYGLSPELALASVTSVPANAAGLGHRVGTVAGGFDADIVVWDSHPLTLGATPVQVYVDGISQLSESFSLEKSAELQVLPSPPNWDKEKNATVEFEGVPPLRGKRLTGRVRVKGVKSLVTHDKHFELWPVFDDFATDRGFPDGRTVLIDQGTIQCVEGPGDNCSVTSWIDAEEETAIDLAGGSIGPGLTTYGSPLGLVEIRLEPSTNDGPVPDLLKKDPPALLADAGPIRAVDGLAFEGRGALLAYRSGVTTAVTAPTGGGFLQGIATAFRLGAPHALSKGAIIQAETAVHISLSHDLDQSVSTQIAVLRSALLSGDGLKTLGWSEATLSQIREGEIRLVISVENADIMATVLALKQEVESHRGAGLQLTFVGASEAHLIAEDLHTNGVSVILTSPRPYPGTWEQRRILPGPPLSKESSLVALLNAGVHVGIGVANEAEARNTRFELTWAMLESNGAISKYRALTLATTALDRALGLRHPRMSIPDLVLYQGGDLLDFESKPVAVVSAASGVVETF